MSRYFSGKYAALTPYTPGEQPRDMRYIKLNTNESPYPPSPLAREYARKAAQTLQLYSDPTCKALTDAASALYGLCSDEMLFTNGSDEILNFAFMAFCDSDHGACFPDVTYGFYPVFAELSGIPYRQIPLKEDFTVDPGDYQGCTGAIFIANPNAPTGLALTRQQIEALLTANPDSVVVVDEAYVDFGGESCVGLIRRYPNLLVTQTFSKSRNLAGGRLGMGFGCRELIQDLNTIKYSTNPYNVNSMTMAAGVGALEDRAYFEACCREIVTTRAATAEALEALGFTMPQSLANFLFIRHPRLGGLELYQTLKRRGILVRHFETPRLKDYNRVTIGSPEQMETLIAALKSILEELS